MSIWFKSNLFQSKGRPSLARVWGLKAWEQRRRMATVAAAGLTVAVAYHVVFGANGLTVYEQKRTENRVLTQQLDDLSRENEALHGHVDRLQADPNAIEHEAREELHYTRPGEVIITLPADGKKHLTKVVGQP